MCVMVKPKCVLSQYNLFSGPDRDLRFLAYCMWRPACGGGGGGGGGDLCEEETQAQMWYVSS